MEERIPSIDVIRRAMPLEWNTFADLGEPSRGSHRPWKSPSMPTSTSRRDVGRSQLNLRCIKRLITVELFRSADSTNGYPSRNWSYYAELNG